MNAEIIDEATAKTVLSNARDRLLAAAVNLTDATDHVRELVVKIRPLGLLTVDEMATALVRDRNYVDSIWSMAGKTQQVEREGELRVKQTRVPVTPGTDPEAARHAFESLADAAATRERALNQVVTERSSRDRLIVTVYASRLLGPSAIGAACEIDRNHVLRIARRANVKPVHRKGTKNQYSASPAA